MRTMSKKLMSIATTVAVSASVLSNFAVASAAVINPESLATKASEAITSGKYATNPNGFGKEATITIDGSISDWSDDMLVAQGAAWDVANNWKGAHENCVLDSYGLYAAWDNDNLYIGWQMVNTTDTWANPGDGPLSDGGRVLDVPLGIALNVGNKEAMTGKQVDGKYIWNVHADFETRVDHILYMSGKPGLGTPGIFTAVDSSGLADTTDPDSCRAFKEVGIQYKMAMDSLPKSIWGLEASTSPSDVYSDSANWVDMMTKGHDRKYDSFYELSIPLSVLGIDKAYLESNGIGVMQLSTRGESALDCLPHDPSMLDNALGDCATDVSTSHEKDDTDVITVPLAQIGKSGGGPTIEKGYIKVEYVDENGTEIATSTNISGNVGTSYTTTAKTVSGYTLKTTPTNATGTYKKGTTTVTYVYKSASVDEGSILVKYVDESGNEISSSVIMSGPVGTGYTTTAKTISGYTLKTIPSNATGTYQYEGVSTPTVTYVYKAINANEGSVLVKYVDQSGNEIAPSVNMSGTIGTNYTTTAKTISGYALKSIPSNANGTYRDGNIIVTYHYVGGVIVAPTVNSFVANKLSPQITGTQVTLTANASGTGTLQYKFLIKDNVTGNWAILKDYTTSNTCIWKLGTVGNKTLYVDVKDSNGKVTRKEMNYMVKQKDKPVVSSFKSDKASPQVSGTSITLNAAASGTGVLQYKFLVKDNKTGNWAIIRDFGIANTCTWKPGAVGDKTLYVDVRDANGEVTRQAMDYKIKGVPPVINSFTADKTSPQMSGTPVVLTAKATGKGTLQYKFLIKDNATGNWAILKDYGTSNTYTWKLGAIGNKTLYVDVKDSNGEITRKEMNYTVKTQLVDEMHSAISYSGDWKTATSPNHSGGSCKYATGTAKATYKFTGKGIKVIAPKANDKGIVKITLDGKSYYVDQYSESAKNQEVIFTMNGLTSGTHTITVEWTGLKNDSSKGNTITLDAFEVI